MKTAAHRCAPNHDEVNPSFSAGDEWPVGASRIKKILDRTETRDRMCFQSIRTV